MRSDSYPAHLASVKSGIEVWTEAVFGHRFQSKGRKYPMEEQDDMNSCGVCVVMHLTFFAFSSFSSFLFFKTSRHSQATMTTRINRHL